MGLCIGPVSPALVNETETKVLSFTSFDYQLANERDGTKVTVRWEPSRKQRSRRGTRGSEMAKPSPSLRGIALS